MRSITTLQQPEEVSVGGTLFDLAAYEKPSKPIHDYDLDNGGMDDDPLEAYKQQCQKSKNTSTSAVASADSATPSTNGFLTESAPPTIATSTPMRSSSTPPTSPTCESTATFAPTSPSVGSSTSLPVDSPAPEPVVRESELDSIIPNQVSGGKDCESCAKSAPDISSGSNLWELSNEDYANWLEPAEWQDILSASSESLLANLGLATNANESSLFVPTLTTGVGSQRNAGRTRCEQKLKEFGIVANGCQFSPEGMAALMGFPLDWFGALTGSRSIATFTASPTDSPNATMFGGLPVDASLQPKQQLPLPSPSGIENDSVRIKAESLSESSKERGSGRRTVCRSCGELISWGKTAAGKNCPFNLDGTSHFTTCPDANRWSRKSQPDDSISDSVPTLSESSCDLKVATAWGEFYGSENGRIWESKSHCQRWNWKNLEVLELEQLGTERLVVRSGRLPIAPDGSRPVVSAVESVKFARPFWVEEEELFAIEEDSTTQDFVPVSSSLNRCEQVPVPLADDSLSSERSSLSESSSRGREKLRELADSLSEEGLRQLVRRLSESLGDYSITEVGQVVIESSSKEKTADSSQEPQKVVLNDSIVNIAVEQGKCHTFTACGDNQAGSPSAESSRLPEEPNPRSEPPRSVEPVLSSSSVAAYRPGGQARGDNEYFRLTWWENGKSRHKHIRGGNTSKPSAISRVRQIIDAIVARWSFPEILALC